jgi:hypothetical protein
MSVCLCSGQGTIALELLEQAPEIDTIIVPISGSFNFLIVSILHFGPASFYLFISFPNLNHH